jgi:hypothetical protein
MARGEAGGMGFMAIERGRPGRNVERGRLARLIRFFYGQDTRAPFWMG